MLVRISIAWKTGIRTTRVQPWVRSPLLRSNWLTRIHEPTHIHGQSARSARALPWAPSARAEKAQAVQTPQGPGDRGQRGAAPGDATPAHRRAGLRQDRLR